MAYIVMAYIVMAEYSTAGAQAQRTMVRCDTLEPVWDETFRFHVESLEDEVHMCMH